jgi:hypothetical protein
VFVRALLLSGVRGVLCCAGLVWTEAALANHDDLPLELAWESPPECPTGQAVREEALRLASTDGRRLPRVEAEVVVERADDSSYVLTLTTGDSDSGSSQTFRAGTCRAVAKAAAVTLALLLNPASSEAKPEELPRRNGSPHGENAVPIRWGLVGQVGAQIGFLPEMGLTVGAETGLELGAFSAWLGGVYGFPQRTMLEADPDVGGKLALASGFAYGCWALVAAAPRLSLCAGLDLSRVAGRGVGVAEEKVDSVYWFSALGGAQADIAVHSNAVVRIGAFAAPALGRPVIFVEDYPNDAGELFRPSRVSGKLYAGIGALLP